MAVLSVCVFALLVSGVHNAQWEDTSPHTGKTIYACSGDNVMLPWAYTLAPNETAGDMHWYLHGVSQEMVAMSSHGYFVPLPAFTNRVDAMHGAGIVLNRVVPTDSGNYSVEVEINLNADRRRSMWSWVVVQVGDNNQLMTRDGSLHVSQSPEAVLDPDTDQWAIQLRCGVFSYSDQPPVQVEWTTPSGDRVNSTHYADGHFNLLLSSPVKGGNYTCHVPPQLSCLDDSATQRGEATLVVDRLEARMTLTDKESEQMREQIKQISSGWTQAQAELNQTRSQLALTNAQLSRTNSELNQTRSQLALINSELSQTSSELSELKLSHANLSRQVQELVDNGGCEVTCGGEDKPPNGQQPLPHRQQVGFHVMNLRSQAPPVDTALVLQDTFYNVGNAYDNTTGRFTAPLSGLYLFLFTTGPGTSEDYAGYDLLKDDEVVGYAYAFRDSGGHANLATVHAVMYMTAGQRAWVRSDGSHYSFGYTSFSGALLAADV